MGATFENRGLRVESQVEPPCELDTSMFRRLLDATTTVAPTNHSRPEQLDRRIPGDRNLPIAGCGLFDMCKRRERVVKPLHQHLLGYQHVVDLTARGFGLQRIVIGGGMPAGVAHKQKRIRQVVDLARAGRNNVGRVTRRVAGRADRGSIPVFGTGLPSTQIAPDRLVKRK
jgi:hypothetical protein